MDIKFYNTWIYKCWVISAVDSTFSTSMYQTRHQITGMIYPLQTWYGLTSFLGPYANKNIVLNLFYWIEDLNTDVTCVTTSQIVIWTFRTQNYVNMKPILLALCTISLPLTAVSGPNVERIYVTWRLHIAVNCPNSIHFYHYFQEYLINGNPNVIIIWICFYWSQLEGHISQLYFNIL